MNPPLQAPLLLLVCFPIFLLLSSPFLTQKVDAANPPTIARPGCQPACGNVSIPFPFGIGAGCFLDPWFEIQCNTSISNSKNNKKKKKPFLARFPNVPVIDITIPDFGNRWFRSVTVGLPSLNGCGANHTKRFGIDLRGSPFNFSTDYNVFLMEGCVGSTLLIDQSNNKVLAGCTTTCHLCYPDTSNLWSIPYRILGILGHFRTLQKYVSKWSDTLTVSVDQKVGHFDRVLV